MRIAIHINLGSKFKRSLKKEVYILIFIKMI